MSFLFSVALAAGVEVPSLKLPEKSADAAMALWELWRAPCAEPVRRRTEKDTAEMEEDPEPGTEPLPWDTVEEQLPEDLRSLWERAQQGTKRLDVKRFLHNIPVFSGIPARPPENNHRSDGRSQNDKVFKPFRPL